MSQHMKRFQDETNDDQKKVWNMQRLLEQASEVSPQIESAISNVMGTAQSAAANSTKWF